MECKAKYPLQQGLDGFAGGRSRIRNSSAVSGTSPVPDAVPSSRMLIISSRNLLFSTALSNPPEDPAQIIMQINFFSFIFRFQPSWFE